MLTLYNLIQFSQVPSIRSEFHSIPKSSDVQTNPKKSVLLLANSFWQGLLKCLKQGKCPSEELVSLPLHLGKLVSNDKEL